jgi:hypothetical protein
VAARLVEAEDRVRAPGDDPYRHRLATTRRRVDGVDPERGERRVHRSGEHRHQVRLQQHAAGFFGSSGSNA